MVWFLAGRKADELFRTICALYWLETSCGPSTSRLVLRRKKIYATGDISVADQAEFSDVLSLFALVLYMSRWAMLLVETYARKLQPHASVAQAVV